MKHRWTKDKKEMKRFLMTAAGVLLFGIVCVMGIVALIKGKKESQVQETMAFQSEEMQLLNELKSKMEGQELTIILDAGHGGNDVGTGSEAYWEKDINLDIVKHMSELLMYCGVQVLFCREGDETVALSDRSAFANAHEEAAYFVSVHCNFCEGDTSVAGLECYYWKDSEKGKQFAQTLIDGVSVCQDIKVRGIKTDDFHVLRETKMPAVLVETGYLSNPEEQKLLCDEKYQKKLALYLVNGILNGACNQP